MTQSHQKNWFGRNWLWFIPLSGCLGIIFLFVFGIGAAIFGVTKIISDLSPVSYALEKVNNNKEAILVLGNNIDDNGFPQGNINIQNENGEVDFEIPIKGDKGEGILILKGIRVNEKWVFEELYIRIKGKQQRIDLLEKALESI